MPGEYLRAFSRTRFAHPICPHRPDYLTHLSPVQPGRYVRSRGLIVEISDVLFDFNQSTLTAGARERLQRLAGILTSYNGGYRVDVEGHADAVGPTDANVRLSDERAAAVRAALVAFGVPADRIAQAHGVGEQAPVATNGTAVGRQMNRRVEIIISDLR